MQQFTQNTNFLKVDTKGFALSNTWSKLINWRTFSHPAEALIEHYSPEEICIYVSKSRPLIVKVFILHCGDEEDVWVEYELTEDEFKVYENGIQESGDWVKSLPKWFNSSVLQSWEGASNPYAKHLRITVALFDFFLKSDFLTKNNIWQMQNKNL